MENHKVVPTPQGMGLPGEAPAEQWVSLKVQT